MLSERVEVPVAIDHDSEGDGVKVTGEEAQFVFTMFDLSFNASLLGDPSTS